MSDSNVRWVTVKGFRQPSAVKSVAENYGALVFDVLDVNDTDADGKWTFRALVVVADEGAVINLAYDLATDSVERGFTATVHATYAEAREDLLA